MDEAICFGWIDTIVKRIDEDTFMRFFSRRNKNSKWSYNTLSYGEQLIKDKKMTQHGLKFYNEGKKKLPHDHGIPRNPEVPKEILNNKKTKEKFEKLAPSIRRMHLRWVARAKQEETKKRRIEKLIEILKQK